MNQKTPGGGYVYKHATPGFRPDGRRASTRRAGDAALSAATKRRQNRKEMVPLVPVAKKIELMGWYFLQTGSEQERKNIVQQAYRLRGEDGIRGLAAATGYSRNRLVKIGRLWEIKEEVNRVRRGRGDGQGRERRQQALDAEVVSIASQHGWRGGEDRATRRDATASTISRKARRIVINRTGFIDFRAAAVVVCVTLIVSHVLH